MEQTTFKPKILVTILHQGWMRPEMLPVFFSMANDVRAQITIAPLKKRPYEENLNTATKMTREGGYDFLITFDHDNIPKNNPIDLVFLNKDIIGMPYPTYGFSSKGELETALLAMDKQPGGGYRDHRTMEGLQEVDAIASGAMVIARRVLENPKVFFARKWDDQGFVITGVDFHFCEKAKAEGFKVWAHYDYLADHIKEISLLEVAAFRAR